MNRRFPLVVIAGVVVALLIATVVLLQTDLDPLGFGDSDDAAPVYNAASSLEGGPDEVLFISGTTLIRRDVAAGEEEPVTDVPSPNVYAAPGSTWLAYVTTRSGAGDAVEPVVQLYDPETETKHRAGPGVRPVWNAEGTHVAYLRPLVPSECRGEDCPGELEIGVVDATTGESSVLLAPGRYSILGWAGDRVLVSNFDKPKSIISVSLDDERTKLPMSAEEFVAASPDGNWILKKDTNPAEVTASENEFIALEDGELSDERIPVDLAAYQILEGAFSHDGTRVAAITSVTAGIEQGKGKDKKIVNEETTTQVHVFSPDDPQPVLVEESFGAGSHLLWSVDNESVVFVRSVDPAKALFQASQCPVASEGECSVVTSWTEGVAILRAE